MTFSFSKAQNCAAVGSTIFGILSCAFLAAFSADATEAGSSELSITDIHDFCADPSLSYQQKVDFFLDGGWSIVHFDPFESIYTSDWDPKNAQHAVFIANSILRFAALPRKESEVKSNIESYIKSKPEEWFFPMKTQPSGVTFFKDGEIISFTHAPLGITGRPPSTVVCYFYGSFLGDEGDLLSLGGVQKGESTYSKLYRFSFSPPESNMESYLLTFQGKHLSDIFETSIGDMMYGHFIFEFSN